MAPIERAATMSLEDYNPVYVIDAVNILQPLGKEQALQRIEAYLVTHDKTVQPYGLFWVLRALFDLPSKQAFPPVRIGQPSIPDPEKAEAIPRFPIVIIEDIPLLVVREYYLGGLPEAVEAHIAYFRTHGALRSHVLTPGPLANIEQEFLRLWNATYGNSYLVEALATIREQIARLRE